MSLPAKGWWLFVLLAGACSPSSGNSRTPGADSQAGLPQILSTQPSDGESGLALDTRITILFDRAMDESSFGPGNLELQGGGRNVGLDVHASGNQITLRPVIYLQAGTQYSLQLGTDLRDSKGNRWGRTRTIQFTTLFDADFLSVVSTLPAPAAVDVDVLPTIKARFNTLPDPATLDQESFFLQGPEGRISSQVTILENEALLTPAEALVGETAYTVTLLPRIANLSGKSLEESYSWSFTTRETLPPEVLSTDPGDDEGDVSWEAIVEVVFSESIDPGSVIPETFSLMDDQGIVIPALYEVEGEKIQLLPELPLYENTVYTAMLTTGVTDLVGNPLEFPHTWSFTTIALPPADCIAGDVGPGQGDFGFRTNEGGEGLVLWGGASGDRSKVFGKHFNGADYTFGSTFSFADSLSDYSNKYFNPVVDSDGNALALFTIFNFSNNGGDTHDSIYAITYDASTGQWDPGGLVPVEDDFFFTCNGSVKWVDAEGDDRGNYMAVWTQEVCRSLGGDSIHSVWARRYDGTAGIWDPQGPVLLELEESGEPAWVDIISDPQGNFHVTWNQEVSAANGGNDMHSIYYRKFDATLGQWEGDDAILLEEDDTGDAYSAAAGVDGDGNVHVAWLQRIDPANGGDGQTSVYYRYYDSRKSEWGSDGPVLLETDGSGYCSEPRMAVDSQGNAMVIWIQEIDQANGGDGKRSLFARYYDASTRSWNLEGPLSLESESKPCYYPQLTIDSQDTFYITWWQRVNGQRVWRTRFLPGRGWDTKKLVFDKDSGSRLVSHAMTHGRAIAMWVRRAGNWKHEYTICD